MSGATIEIDGAAVPESAVRDVARRAIDGVACWIAMGGAPGDDQAMWAVVEKVVEDLRSEAGAARPEEGGGE